MTLSKYRNVKTEVNGITFSSKKEAAHYWELTILEKVGEISNLEIQPKFKIEINGCKVCTYIADFKYVDNAGHVVIEDVKGIRTPIYRLKKKLVKAVHNIDIVEV